MMSNKVVTVFLVAFLATAAQPAVGGTYHAKNCSPGSVDGSQVFESWNAEGICDGRAKVVVRVTDYVLQVTCSVQGLTCTHVKNMSAEQRAHYERLQQFRAVQVKNPKVCVQTDDNGTFRHEFITGGKTLCEERYNSARYYDLVLRKACVKLGKTLLGCVPLDEEHVVKPARMK